MSPLKLQCTDQEVHVFPEQHCCQLARWLHCSQQTSLLHQQGLRQPDGGPEQPSADAVSAGSLLTFACCPLLYLQDMRLLSKFSCQPTIEVCMHLLSISGTQLDALATDHITGRSWRDVHTETPVTRNHMHMPTVPSSSAMQTPTSPWSGPFTLLTGLTAVR